METTLTIKKTTRRTLISNDRGKTWDFSKHVTPDIAIAGLTAITLSEFFDQATDKYSEFHINLTIKTL